MGGSIRSIGIGSAWEWKLGREDEEGDLSILCRRSMVVAVNRDHDTDVAVAVAIAIAIA